MRYLLLVFCVMFLSLPFDSFAADTAVPNSSQLEVRLNVTYIKGENTPYSGTAIDFFENGRKKMEAVYKDGKREGMVTFWFETGQKKREETWHNGKK